MANRPASGKAVFLDRDGTLNHDPGYISDPADLILLPGVTESLSQLKKAGFLLVVVTNQSGVARGLIQPGQLERIHEKMNTLLSPFGAEIDDFRSCVHHPDEGCECRKPGARMLLEAAEDLGIDLAASVMIGDRFTDVEAGRNAQVGKVILVKTGVGSRTELKMKEHGVLDRVHFVAEDLPAATRWILET